MLNGKTILQMPFKLIFGEKLRDEHNTDRCNSRYFFHHVRPVHFATLFADIATAAMFAPLVYGGSEPDKCAIVMAHCMIGSSVVMYDWDERMENHTVTQRKCNRLNYLLVDGSSIHFAICPNLTPILIDYSELIRIAGEYFQSIQD